MKEKKLYLIAYGRLRDCETKLDIQSKMYISNHLKISVLNFAFLVLPKGLCFKQSGGKKATGLCLLQQNV